jgi:two-component system OmpR family response regulator
MAVVLVVDDDREMAELLRLILRRYGHVSRLVFNGKEAVEAIRNEAPDIVLLDIMMRDLDGFAVYQLIKDIAGDVPIIFLTAYDGLENKERARQLGADDFLGKLFLRGDVLARRIQSVLASVDRTQQDNRAHESVLRHDRG